MKFKEIGESIGTADFWYDLFDGGYIEPEEVLKNKEDIDKVNNAISVLKEFRNKGFNMNIFEEM